MAPLAPGEPKDAITTPMFDKITIQLDLQYYKNKNISIEREVNTNGKIKSIELGGKAYERYFITHKDLVNGSLLKVIQN